MLQSKLQMGEAWLSYTEVRNDPKPFTAKNMTKLH